MKHIVFLSLILSCWTAGAANYIDPNGIEWMRLDATFGFASQVPAKCSPHCSGVAGNVALDGWSWASRDQVQVLFDTVGMNFLSAFGTSQMFVTTYTYSAAAYGSTSTVDPVSGQYFYGAVSEGHNMVSFQYSAGFSAGPPAIPGARLGAFLNRSSAQPKNCVYNGSEVKHNASITAFKTATVLYGQSCVSEQRVCVNGAFTGTFTNSSCSVLPPRDCYYNGSYYSHGQTVTGFAALTAPYGGSCTSLTRTCSNGSFGVTIYPTCTVAVNPPTPPGMKCRWKKGKWECEKR